MKTTHPDSTNNGSCLPAEKRAEVDMVNARIAYALEAIKTAATKNNSRVKRGSMPWYRNGQYE